MATSATRLGFDKGFNRENLRHAREVVERKLAEAALELMIPKIELGRISFDSNTASAKCVMVAPPIVRTGGLTLTPVPTGNTAEWTKSNVQLGMVFKWVTRKNYYTVVEIKPTHVIAKTQRGTRYKLTYTHLNTMIKQ